MIQVLLRTCSDEEGITVEKGATRPFTGNKIRAIMNLDAAPVSQPAQPEASSLFLPSPVGERLLRHRRQKRTCIRRRARCLSSAYPNCSTCLTMASACHYGHQRDKEEQGDATTFYAEGITRRESVVTVASCDSDQPPIRPARMYRLYLGTATESQLQVDGCSCNLQLQSSGAACPDTSAYCTRAHTLTHTVRTARTHTRARGGPAAAIKQRQHWRKIYSTFVRLPGGRTLDPEAPDRMHRCADQVRVATCRSRVTERAIVPSSSDSSSQPLPETPHSGRGNRALRKTRVSVNGLSEIRLDSIGSVGGGRVGETTKCQPIKRPLA